MRRRVLLVDDDVTILLTMKAVLELNGFDVETAASAKEAKTKLRTREYQMVITDLRMEREASGEEVIAAAKKAASRPAIALLTAYPVDDEGWENGGADELFVKATHTRVLIEQIEKLFASHAAKMATAQAKTTVGPKKAVAPVRGKKKPQVVAGKAKAGVKAAAKTAAKSAKKTAAKPAVKKAAKSASKTAGKPASKAVSKLASKAAGKVVAKKRTAKKAAKA